ncbi:MAG: hypothetical protein JXQ90_11105 [Cyclobacteriaceae bacterium]
MELAIYNLLVVYGGHRIDLWLQLNTPWFIILAVLLSVVGTVFYLLKRLS